MTTYSIGPEYNELTVGEALKIFKILSDVYAEALIERVTLAIKDYEVIGWLIEGIYSSKFYTQAFVKDKTWRFGTATATGTKVYGFEVARAVAMVNQFKDHFLDEKNREGVQMFTYEWHPYMEVDDGPHEA